MNLLKSWPLPALVISSFIGFGDRLLPSPLNTYSYQSRTTINRFLTGLMPHMNPQNPHERTETAVDDLYRH